MKYIANIFRILVGGLLVFSGFVKLVDPVGTGIKLKEYFEVFSADVPALSGFFGFFAQHSLALSLFFCSFEVVLGIALLLNYRTKLMTKLALAMMLFFTFLTFYSAYFNKVTDCGCFGDFLKLKPWVSFSKDVVLSFMLIVMLFLAHSFKTSNLNWPIIAASLVCLGIGLHAIFYLPTLDFLPYAAGKSIPEQMKPAEKPKFVFTMEKAGQTYTFDNYPTDPSYKYVSSTITNEEASKAKITDYAITNMNGEIVTDSSFVGNVLLVAFKHLHDIDSNTARQIGQLISETKEIKTFVVSSESPSDLAVFNAQNQIKAPAYAIDEKVLKTIARAEPCLILMQNGTVLAKWSGLELPNSNELRAKLK